MESKIYSLLAAFLLFGTVCSQVSNSLDFDDIKKQIDDNGGPSLEELEKRLAESGVILPDLNNTKVDIEKVEQVFKEKCEKQGAYGAVDSLKEQQETLKNCMTEKVDAAQIQEELEEAKKTGSMDEVFTKYCNKWPEIYGCIENVTVTVRSCMTEEEATAFNKSLKIVDDLKEFMCFKDGDRLAMFVAEGGVECIEEQKEGIQRCLNATIGNRMPNPSEFSLGSLPTFLFTKEDCLDFDEIRTCVNVELEKCKDTTPANIVDALFKFLKKQMPCENDGQTKILNAAASSEKANSAYNIVNSVLVTLGMFTLVKFY